MTASALVMPLTTAHAGEVLAIRQAGIDEGNTAFETTAPAWEQFGPAQLSEHRSATLDETCRALGAVVKVASVRPVASSTVSRAAEHPSEGRRSDIPAAVATGCADILSENSPDEL
ncbi:hypothetical protein ACFFSH_04810 [Streptomyces filamentosus]|uniref:Uncharacterized protein n=1 Tax=Streptomyces filamentosus TaxID=67294 RepID=A0A919BX16_STRFL|nr:hypothetical protein [Streptomyces filamentosus]GHG23998.1 hypothetical protein GCM10017667_69410 [Streptomyces filamentosus]